MAAPAETRAIGITDR